MSPFPRHASRYPAALSLAFMRHPWRVADYLKDQRQHF